MKTIYKYQIEVASSQKVEMRDGAEILCAQTQHGKLCIWALVDPYETMMVNRNIEVFGTGHDIRECEERKYIGSVQMLGGSLVWHIFERIA